GDGIEDLVVASGLGFVALHPGNAGGGFAAALPERVEGLGASEMTRADLDADSLADLVALERDTGALRLLFGRGDGTFDVVDGPAASGAAAGLVVADFNGDRIPDLIISGPEITVGIASVSTPPIVAGDA